ncbi:hypothetical protein CONLIGDRAFT_644437 [Coniochaeta ligniaria NRRL 30616]|uniref:Antigenic cell wall galactomanno protein n=1 Tax=Coniochaeta ligniaria NRRL 30616 TaxID=1408157 RepID=A0A1J7ILV2_9PEZI|nr:hypothetical protein CONLIGDRAFT_644437 [Coniochaeta ligniaria NRRL 30616]
MRFTTVLAPLAFLASTVAASGATIADAVGVINTVTLELQSKVTSWKGDLLGTLPIIVASTELLTDINNATKTTKASAPLDALEALTVAIAVNNLSGSVNATISAIIAKKHQFDKLLLSPVILLNLELEKDATDKLGAALADKVPEDLKAAAATLQATIDGYFNTGIQAYKLF